MKHKHNGMWRTRKLNELGFVGRGKSRHRPRNAPELYGGSYPFVQTADIMASEFYITSYSKTYSEAGLAQSKMWEPNTLCMTIAGENTAETAILSFPACFPDSVVGFVADPEQSDVRFVKYYLDYIKRKIRQVTRGATQDNLSLDKLLSFDIIAPPVQLQAKIAGIAAAYDELILNNSRRITVLEKMAQAIYREWFVNFRFPGHEKVELFNSPLGKIPEGWKATTLGEVADLAYGKALKADHRKPGPFAVYGSGGVVGFHEEAYTRGPGIIVGRKGNVGSVFWSDEAFFPIDTVFFVNTKVSLHYVYYNLSLSQSFLNSDAAVPGLNRNQAYRNPFVLPPHDVLASFEDNCRTVFAALRNLRKRNDNLRMTRDLLLPKLISGQLDVEGFDIETREPRVEATA